MGHQLPEPHLLPTGHPVRLDSLMERVPQRPHQTIRNRSKKKSLRNVSFHELNGARLFEQTGVSVEIQQIVFQEDQVPRLSNVFCEITPSERAVSVVDPEGFVEKKVSLTFLNLSECDGGFRVSFQLARKSQEGAEGSSDHLGLPTTGGSIPRAAQRLVGPSGLDCPHEI